MCLGACAEAACCCAGAACCSCLCVPAKALGAAPKTFARIGYVVFQIIWILVTLLAMWILSAIINTTTWVGITCPAQSGGGSSCAGSSLLVRMSFALALCHTIVFLICLLRNEMAAKFYEGCWCFKFLIVAAMLVGSLWIPNEPFYYGYLHFAQWISFFFLCFQAMLMLIVAYVIND